MQQQRLWSVETTRALESQARMQEDDDTLLLKAGLSVARLSRARFPSSRRVWVACGPGGNGADGLHAAAFLQRWGWQVCVSLHADPSQMAACVHRALKQAVDSGVQLLPEPPSATFDLVIDALLGLGANRPPSALMAHAIRLVQGRTGPCLAIDLPSGIHAQTGHALGPEVVQADITLALLTLKTGHFTAMGRTACQELWFDDLGMTPPVSWAPQAVLSSRADFLRTRPSRAHHQHKGSFGDALVIGGAAGMTGAAVLAAHAALAAGPGRTLVSLLGAMPQGLRPECLTVDQAWRAASNWLERSTVVCGCGGGETIRQVLPDVLARSTRLVLDADGLNAVAQEPVFRSLLQTRRHRGQTTVLTPHPLEAARLLCTSTADVQSDRLAAARSLASEFGAVVVLKGSGTVIQGPEGGPTLNSTGNAALACGGTGDVLAGWMGGLWSQRVASTANAESCAVEAAISSVWLHGAAAPDRPGPVQAGDLIDRMIELSCSAA